MLCYQEVIRSIMVLGNGPTNKAELNDQGHPSNVIEKK